MCYCEGLCPSSGTQGVGHRGCGRVPGDVGTGLAPHPAAGGRDLYPER